MQSAFLKISDKYEPHKGSDILIMFLTIMFLYIRTHKKRTGFEMLFFLTSAFGPLLLYKSRGAFIALLIYFIFELYYLRKEILNAKFLRNIIVFFIGLIVMLQSVFFVTQSGTIKIQEANKKIEQVTKYRAPELKPGEYVNYLYIKDKRFYSTDVNINWRIQIWQDVYFDLSNDQKLILGNGYSDKIPAMAALDAEGNSVRSGLDGLNENVHNFFINILARGGLVHICLYLLLFYKLIKTYKKKYGSYDICIILLPVLFTSFFDASMENSHYPLIFYFLIGMVFNSDQIFTDKNN